MEFQLEGIKKMLRALCYNCNSLILLLILNPDNLKYKETNIKEDLFTTGNTRILINENEFKCPSCNLHYTMKVLTKDEGTDLLLMKKCYEWIYNYE